MYPIDEKTLEELENRFTYHAPLPGQAVRYEFIRQKAKELAFLIAEVCPKSREQSLGLTHLEECVHWANASIARNEKGERVKKSPQ